MALTFALSPGQAHDGPEGRKLLTSLGPQDAELALVMDRAYQGDETRQLALDLGFTPVVPPIKTRTDPWEYDREMSSAGGVADKCPWMDDDDGRPAAVRR